MASAPDETPDGTLADPVAEAHTGDMDTEQVIDAVERPATGAPVTAPVTVLIVDDQARFLTVAATVVERTAGFPLVGRAVDGGDAVEQAWQLRPPLVLMDINMPVLDGIAAARRIVDGAPGTIVVLLSSYDRDDLPDGFAASGAVDYLHKEELDPAALRRLWDEHGQLDRSS